MPSSSGPPSTGKGRLWLMAGLFLAGVLVLPPLRHWIHSWGPRQTVTAFLEALKTGDREAVVRLVSPEKSTKLLSGDEWAPSQLLKYRIDRIDIREGLAIVNVTVSELGYSIKPEFTLELSPDGRWLVVEVGNVEIDPQWEIDEQRRARRRDENLARELEAAVRDLPGVVVERDDGVIRR